MPRLHHLLLLLLLLLLPSCTTLRQQSTTTLTQQSTLTHRDTIRHRDTIHHTLRDTLLHRDTILLKTYPSADTIIRQLIIHRQSIRHHRDTIRLAALDAQSSLRDTIRQTTQDTHTQTTLTPTNPRSSLLHRLSLIFWLLVILTLIYLLIKEKEK